MSLELPAFIGRDFDRQNNPRSWLGIREASGADLANAVRYTHDIAQREVLRRLLRAFETAGGRAANALADILPFPPRHPPSWAPAQRTVSLPTRVDAEPPAEAAD